MGPLPQFQIAKLIQPFIIIKMKKKIFYLLISVVINIVLLTIIDVIFGKLVTPLPKQINKHMGLGDAYPSNYRDYFYEALANDGTAYFWPGPEESSLYRNWDVTEEYVGYKILAIGDSFTYGQGLRRSDTYPAQLAKVSQDKARAQNWGSSGDNIDEIHKRLLKGQLTFKPDLIIYAYVLNDMPYLLSEEIAVIDAYPANQAGAQIKWDFINFDFGLFEKSRSELLATLCRYSNIINYFVSLRERDEISERTTRHYQDIHNPEKNLVEMERTISKIIEMKEFAKEKGSDFLVMIYPLLYWPDGKYPFEIVHETWAKLLKEKEVNVLDLKEALAKYEDKELWVHPIDQHPNDFAQKVVAEEIYRWIKDHRDHSN